MSNSHQILQFLQQVSLHLLTPHPRNASIYGTDEDVSDLVELIAESNWVEPLVVTPNYVIVSGHRRWKACQILRKENIPVVIREFSDDIAILKTLLLENVSRHKTVEQRIREGIAWESIERDKARKRQGTRTDLSNIPANLPECSRGESRNAIAKRIGFSGSSYSKGRNIIERIDSELNEGNDPSAQALRSVLGKSIDAAHQLLAKSTTERTCVAKLMETGKARSVSAAIRLLEKANSLEKQPSTLTKLVSPGSTEFKPQTKTQSCWNCQHRLEAVDNQSIYCNKFGILNLIDKSADDHAQECPEWKDPSSPLESKPTFVLKLLLPIEWQKELEEKAASLGNDPAVWVTNLISASLFPASNFERHSNDKVNFSNGNYSENNQSNASNTAIALTPPIAKIYNLHSRQQARSNEQSFRGGLD